MADAKISALTELAAAPATNDLLVVDDVSDTTQAASGTTKKLTVANLFDAPTIGSSAADTLTINAGVWTLGSNYTATRAAGALATGTVTLQAHSSTFSGDAGGATSGRGFDFSSIVSGANAMSAAHNQVAGLQLNHTAGVISNARAIFGACTVSNAGTVTTLDTYHSVITVSSTGGVTTASNFKALAPTLSSTGVITTHVGFNAANLGHATLVTNAFGFDCANFTAAATLTVAYRSQMTSGSTKWGFYASGTADNAFTGNTRIGSVVAPTETLHVTGTLATSGIGAIGTTTSSTTTLNLPLGATGVSSLRIAQGVAPSSPVDGDMWTTALGLFVDTSGGTRGPHGYTLAASGANVPDKGNVTSEETFATITVPANAMGANGTIRVWHFWSYTNSANDKIPRVRFSGAAGTQFQALTATTSATLGAVCQIQNRNATNSQVSGESAGATSSLGVSANPAVTASVDTTASTTIVITGQKETGTETLTLERYMVEVFPSA